MSVVSSFILKVFIAGKLDCIFADFDVIQDIFVDLI